MDRTPSDENAEDDATNKTPEPNPDELEDNADETAPPPDGDVINDSEPDLENVTDEKEGAPEEEALEESSELADVEVPVEEAIEDEEIPEELLVEANVEEVPLEALEDETTENVEEGESGPSEEEAEFLPMDEKKIEESIIEFIEDKVLTKENELEGSDSGHLAMLAEGIVTAIISSSVVPSITGLSSKGTDEEMDVVPEGEEVEEEEGAGEEEEGAGEEEEVGAVDGLFPTPRMVKMVDKAVQVNAKEIDEALEALSAESLPLEEGGELEITTSAESGVTSEGEAYQSCEEISEIADEDQPCGKGVDFVPCPYEEQVGGETDEEEGGEAAEVGDDSQWEDLPDAGEEAPSPMLIEGADLTDQGGEFDTSIPSATQDETPMAQDKAYSPVVEGEAYIPAAQGETYVPSAPPVQATSPSYVPSAPPVSAPQESYTPKPSVAPDSVRRIESSGGIKPAQPMADSPAPRAVASDTQRRPAAQPAITPRRESREECEWQQAIGCMTDKLFESPYNYICKFVILCAAIRAVRNIFQATRFA